VTRDAPDEHESQAQDDDRPPARQPIAPAMTDAVLASGLGASLPPHLFRPIAPELIQAIIDRVRAGVPAYAGSEEADPCPLLDVVARESVLVFLNGGRATESERRKVDELFQRLGHREAKRGNDPGPMVAALRIASRCAWEQLADFAVAQQFSGATVRDISASLMQYADHLRDQLLSGFELGSRFTTQDRASSRARLMDFIIHSTVGRISPLRPLGMDHSELRRLAEAAAWPLPDQVVALGVSFHGSAPVLPDRDDVLSRVRADRVFVLCPAQDAEDLVEFIARSGTDRRVALSWPVDPDEAGSAFLWTARALDLVRLGVIAPTPLVRCSDHVTQLWLQAEPSMRQRLCQDLLKPLLAETPNSREILSDTLLAWLETRDSAPAIAARLDVHPQTVRYRWKRINELFGESLHDPEFVLQMTMVLKASLLMWKAGNQSDFERFRDGRLADE
jgi:hypothetical protein